MTIYRNKNNKQLYRIQVITPLGSMCLGYICYAIPLTPGRTLRDINMKNFKPVPILDSKYGDRDGSPYDASIPRK